MDIRAALDPGNITLFDWNARLSAQPCLPYGSQPGAGVRASYGASWTGVLCGPTWGDVGTGGGVPYLYLYNSYGALNSRPVLAGTLPLALRDLRTAKQVLLYFNALTGSIPDWGAVTTWVNFPASAGFGSLTVLRLDANALTGARSHHSRPLCSGSPLHLNNPGSWGCYQPLLANSASNHRPDHGAPAASACLPTERLQQRRFAG